MKVSKEEWCLSGHNRRYKRHRHNGRMWSEYSTGRASKEEPGVVSYSGKGKGVNSPYAYTSQIFRNGRQENPLKCHKPGSLRQERHPTKRPQE